ncbi:MAG: ABC transporter permease [Ruminiclostridium sp.]|nr:ABC transporter permease [Ruminiclostridium sp.]
MRFIMKLVRSRTLFGCIAVGAFWYLLHAVVSPRSIPGPLATVATLVRLLYEGNLPAHMAVSILRISAALSSSIVLGVPLGLWMGLNKKIDAILAPVAYILYPLPKIAFLPVFMILFGLGDGSKTILIITVILFPILLAARDGVKEIPEQLFYSVMSLGLNRFQIYTNLVIPAVLPKVITAIRISIGISISVLFFSENYATVYGIGYFIMNSWAIVRYDEMFAGILALSLIGLVIFKLVDIAEKKTCRWLFISK